MTWPAAIPLTYADWRALKAATRHRRYLERMAEADEVSAAAWLAAVERDDRTDPYEARLPAVVEGGDWESVTAREQDGAVIARGAPRETAA